MTRRSSSRSLSASSGIPLNAKSRYQLIKTLRTTLLKKCCHSSRVGGPAFGSVLGSCERDSLVREEAPRVFGGGSSGMISPMTIASPVDMSSAGGAASATIERKAPLASSSASWKSASSSSSSCEAMTCPCSSRAALASSVRPCTGGCIGWLMSYNDFPRFLRLLLLWETGFQP